MDKREASALVGALVCSSIFVAGKFDNAFVYDDVFVVGGQLIHDPGRIGEVFATHAMIAHGDTPPLPMDTYRPLSLVTFFWDAWLSGHATWSYHLTNHVVHLAVVATLFVLVRRLLPQAALWNAAAVAVFFGVSPQLGEAHVWINGRSDPLATLFGLLSLLAWHGTAAGERSRPLTSWVAPALFFAGLLFKETLLFALPSLLLWPWPAQVRPMQRIGRVLPFAVAAAGYLTLRSWALGGLHATDGTDQLVRALRNLPVLWLDGLSQLIAPTRLYLRSMRDEYGLISSTQRIALTLLALVFVWLTLMARRRLPVLCWGLVWFACTLAPAAMISVLLWPGFGRYLYMPCAGIALGMAELLLLAETALGRRFVDAPERMQQARTIAAAALGVYLLSLGTRLAMVTADYADNKSLYMTAALAAPQPAYAFAWLGTARAEAGDLVGSIGPLQRAVALDPTEPSYLHDLARSLMLTGRVVEAERALRSAIARAPAGAAGNLRVLLVRTLAGVDPKAAMAELCECLHHQPDYPDCRQAPAWLLDPRGSRIEDFREEFASFDTTCKSARAREAMSLALAAGGWGR